MVAGVEQVQAAGLTTGTEFQPKPSQDTQKGAVHSRALRQVNMEAMAGSFQPLLSKLAHRLRVLIRAAPDHSHENVSSGPRRKNTAGIVALHQQAV